MDIFLSILLVLLLLVFSVDLKQKRLEFLKQRIKIKE